MEKTNESNERGPFKRIKYKDSTVNYHIMEYMEYKKNFMPHNCLCCNRQIDSGIAVLFVSNHKYMPNFFAHAECLKEHENNTDKLFSDIESKWQKYKKLKKYFEE